jgi:hypothetical protein
MPGTFGSAFMRLASMPSISGMGISIRITLGRGCRATAPMPLAASPASSMSEWLEIIESIRTHDFCDHRRTGPETSLHSEEQAIAESGVSSLGHTSWRLFLNQWCCMIIDSQGSEYEHYIGCAWGHMRIGVEEGRMPFLLYGQD